MNVFETHLTGVGFYFSFQVCLFLESSRPPLCWKSNNPRARAPWQNYLPYESMAKSKCFWQNRIALTLWPFLQINPEKMTSLQMCRIKKITPCSIQTFWDCQLCFYVKKLFVSEKTQKSELCHFSWEIYVIKFSTLRTRTYARGAKFDDINLLRKMKKFTFLCFFTKK